MNKNIFVFIFIIFHIISITIWNLNKETDIDEKIIDFISPYMYSLSLWQAWNIFSPDPYIKETTIRIVVNIDNETVYYFAENNPFLFTRFRKFNDNIIANKDTSLNVPYLIYLCKKFNKIYDSGYKITLQIMYRDISLPKKNMEVVTYETLEDIKCS